MSSKTFAEMFAEAESRDNYWTEVAILDFTADLWQVMQSQGITKSELAEKIGTSKAYVTKVFSGNANFTLQTMVKLSRAVGANFHVHVAKQEACVHWFDSFDSNRTPVAKHLDTVNEECSKILTPTPDWGSLLNLNNLALNG